MKNKLDLERKGSLGFFKALAMAVGFMLAVFALCFCVFGCSTVRTYGPIVLHSVFGLTEKTNEVESVTSVDAVPFDSLVWESGGFAPASSTVVKGHISSVAFNGRTITYNASVDSDWGTEGNAPNATICAVFFRCADGVYRGGKFDWVGFIGKPRPAQHIVSYSGWSHSYPAPKGEEFCFVLIRGDNRRYRTNIINGEVK